MKLIKLALVGSFSLFTVLTMSSCAAGAATAAYAIKAQTADNLSADGEQRIVERAKREILSEMSYQNK
jgi:hypothetical protein